MGTCVSTVNPVRPSWFRCNRHNPGRITVALTQLPPTWCDDHAFGPIVLDSHICGLLFLDRMAHTSREQPLLEAIFITKCVLRNRWGFQSDSEDG